MQKKQRKTRGRSEEHVGYLLFLSSHYNTPMKLVYRIPLITGIILIFTAVVNIMAFQYFSEKYFSTYVAELSKESTPDPTRIQALLQIGKLDKKDQAEYLAIFSELANISTSIENISKNPELYMGSGGSDTMFSIPSVSSYK